MLITRTENSEN